MAEKVTFGVEAMKRIASAKVKMQEASHELRIAASLPISCDETMKPYFRALLNIAADAAEKIETSLLNESY